MMQSMNKYINKIIVVSLVLVLGLCTVACGLLTYEKPTDVVEETDEENSIVVGFSQPGAESEWRVALTESVKSAFTEEKGYKLIYRDGQSKQDTQIRDLRTFIQQGVDYIILAPIVETGWDQVLEEAKMAGIPVIICDRGVSVSNESLYTTYVGSDFKAEGRRAIQCIEEILEKRQKSKPPVDEGEEVEETFNIVHIQGTIGSSAQVGRTKALEDAVEEHGNWKIIAQSCGEFTKAKAREEMLNILSTIDGRDIDLVYCENDEEAYGVMAALNEAGLSYGDNGIIIVSFDGTNTALSMCMSGLINIEVECNPLQGDYLYYIVSMLEEGEVTPKLVYIEEHYYTKYMLTQEFIDSREY